MDILELATTNFIYEQAETCRASRDRIQLWLAAAEQEVEKIILSIVDLEFQQTTTAFERLHGIQNVIATLLYKYEHHITSKLLTFVRAFDRLDTEHSRKYWYTRFQSGLTWPTEA